MIQALKFEFRRAFRRKRFWICISLLLIICIFDFVLFYKSFSDNYMFTSVGQSWIGLDGQFMFNSMIYILLPIIGILPFGASYYEDIKSGYIKNICTKINRKTYYFAKSIATFINSAMVVVIPLVLDLMLCMSVYPIRNPEKLDYLLPITDANAFSKVYYTSAILYILIYILIDAFFIGTLSLYSICVSEWTQSKFITITIPFAAYMVTAVGFYGIDSKNYSFFYLANPFPTFYADEKIVLLLFFALFCVSFIWIALKSRRKDFI